MFSSLENFLLVDNMNVDENELYVCCNCGKKIFAKNTFSDTIGRTYCRFCVQDEKMASIYELAIRKFCNYLDKLDIPYEEPKKLWNGFIVHFPWCNGNTFCHGSSYGGVVGQLTTMGFSADGDDVSGKLACLEAVEIVLQDWNRRCRKMKEEE